MSDCQQGPENDVFVDTPELKMERLKNDNVKFLGRIRELKQQLQAAEQQIKDITEDKANLRKALDDIWNKSHDIEQQNKQLQGDCAGMRQIIQYIKADIQEWDDGKLPSDEVLSDINHVIDEALSTSSGKDLLEHMRVMREALERIANREGHILSPEVKPDPKGGYRVTGPGKAELTKQCAHWMRHTAKDALAKVKAK